jgi:hypothetical protein
MQLTRGEIITEGLDQAGRLDLMESGRLWLNLFLQKQYRTQDYHWLIKDSGNLSVYNGIQMPIDYRAAKSATIGTNGNENRLELLWDAQEFDAKKNIASSTSTPQYVYIDQITKTATFLPTPQSGLIWQLKYFYLPELPDHKDSDTDGLIPVWDASFQILIDAIKQKAYEYNDDARQTSARQELSQDIAMDKMNNHDRRAGRSTMRMGKSFRKRFHGSSR